MRADVIFVMAKAHRSKLQRRFRAVRGGKCVVCLDRPDDHAMVKPELLQLRETKVSRHLPALPPTQEPPLIDRRDTRMSCLNIERN